MLVGPKMHRHGIGKGSVEVKNKCLCLRIYFQFVHNNFLLRINKIKNKSPFATKLSGLRKNRQLCFKFVYNESGYTFIYTSTVVCFCRNHRQCLWLGGTQKNIPAAWASTIFSFGNFFGVFHFERQLFSPRFFNPG